jgi:hypothetical protein
MTMKALDTAITTAINRGRPFTIEDVRDIISAELGGEAFLTQLPPSVLPAHMGRLHNDDRVEAAGRVQVDGRSLRVWAPRQDEMIAWQTLRKVPVLEVAEFCWRNNFAVVFHADELRALVAQDDEFAAITEEAA